MTAVDAQALAEDRGISGLRAFVSRCDQTADRHYLAALDGLVEALGQRPEGREGILTVYDSEDRYVGCIGVKTWNALYDVSPVPSPVPVRGDEQ